MREKRSYRLRTERNPSVFTPRDCPFFYRHRSLVHYLGLPATVSHNAEHQILTANTTSTAETGQRSSDNYLPSSFNIGSHHYKLTMEVSLKTMNLRMLKTMNLGGCHCQHESRIRFEDCHRFFSIMVVDGAGFVGSSDSSLGSSSSSFIEYSSIDGRSSDVPRIDCQIFNNINCTMSRIGCRICKSGGRIR